MERGIVNETECVGANRVRSGGFYRRVLSRTGRTPRLLARLARPLAALALSCFAACQTVAVTGRSQFNMFSIDQDKQLGAEAYTEVLKESKLLKSGPEFAQVKRVIERLIPAVDDPGFQWEFNVIDDPATVNAWCMPGGKIAVYTGILPVAKDDASLAVVLGHEIAHAVARHGTERMSTQNAASTGLAILSQANQRAADYQQLIGVAADLLAFKPWGRKQELEADHIGLIYMARAGYDPRTAVDFWNRMSALSAGKAPPEFLSTHPSDGRRISEIEAALPKAIAEYDRARTGAPQP